MSPAQSNAAQSVLHPQLAVHTMLAHAEMLSAGVAVATIGKHTRRQRYWSKLCATMSTAHDVWKGFMLLSPNSTSQLYSILTVLQARHQIRSAENNASKLMMAKR